MLFHEWIRDHMFVKFKSMFGNKRENEGRDLVKKEVDDVVVV